MARKTKRDVKPKSERVQDGYFSFFSQTPIQCLPVSQVLESMETRSGYPAGA